MRIGDRPASLQGLLSWNHRRSKTDWVKSTVINLELFARGDPTLGEIHRDPESPSRIDLSQAGLGDGSPPWPTHMYPWTDLESFLETRGLSSLPLIGYGSLLNRRSARLTISDPDAQRRAVVAFGVRRVFDYVLDDESLRRYGPVDDPRAIAALNAIATSRVEDTVNGVLCLVSRADIHPLRLRELGYNLTPVECVDFDDRMGARSRAYILTCPDDPPDGVRRRADKIAPHPAYLQVCIEGAREISSEFLDEFLSSTFLADGRTRLAEWDRVLSP